MLNGVPRILILRLSAIGDVVRVLPALYALRRLFPHGQIDWATESKCAAILEEHPLIDQVLVVERSSSAVATLGAYGRLCLKVRRNRYDHVLDFHGILKSGCLTAYSGAKHRYGFARPRSQEGSYLFTNHKVRVPKDALNRIEENFALCDALGAGDRSLDVAIAVPEEVTQRIRQYMDETFHGGKKIVVMHAPVDRAEKQWPLLYFARLADMLLGDGRFDVLFTWGPGQLACVSEVRNLMERSPHVAPELPDLKHYAALVSQSDLYFGGDTGPMHIASAMGVPVVAVFGGTSPVQHSPLREPHRVLYYEGEDEGRDQIPWEERLEKITPEEAYEACVSLLKLRGAPEARS